MNTEETQYEMFPITSLCKADIITAFEKTDKLESVKQRIEQMDESDMKHLADQMADDYLTQLFWDSLRIIFEERFLK
jgi:hypothetical protein